MSSYTALRAQPHLPDDHFPAVAVERFISFRLKSWSQPPLSSLGKDLLGASDMAASPYAAKVAAYSSASTHGGVTAADPHRLIIMLMDGALERIATARGCMERNDIGGKAQLINRTIQIVGELRGSLDHAKGAEVAANLDALYDYICRRLLLASVQNSVGMLDEVTKLLREIRSAWAELPKQAVTK